MTKSIIRVCMAFFALASGALPASVSAQNRPTLVEGGVPVAVGTTFVGTPIGEALFTDASGNPLFGCPPSNGSTKMTGTVTKNSSTTFEGDITTLDLAGTGAQKAGEPEPECTTGFGNVSVTVPGTLQIRSIPLMATDEFQINTKGSPKVKFILESTTLGVCEFESSNPVKGDITTSSTTTALAVRNTAAGSASKLIKGGFLCPSNLQLQMTFHLETENGTSLGITENP